MVFVHGNYVNVHVKNDLPSGFAVVLHDADSFRVCSLLYGISQFLHDFIQVRYFFLWNLVDVLVMLFRNDKGVTHVYGLDAHERDYVFILVDCA